MIKVRQVLLCSAVPFFFLAASCVRENSSRKQDIHVQQMSGFPNQEFGYELGVSACYAGIIGNKLVMAGGCNFAGKSAAEGGPKYFYKGIYTAEITKDSVLVWKQFGELPSPVAYGVSISRFGEMILIGGNNADGGLTSVFRLKLAEDGGAILDTLPSLPFAQDNMSGAASGNTSCMANVIRMSMRYGNLGTLEDGYGINLLPLATFAMDTYADDPCTIFAPKMNFADSAYNEKTLRLITQMHKAITIIQFKLEADIINRRPEFGMENRKLLEKIDFERGVFVYEGKEYEMRDTNFPTVDPKDPYRLTDEEKELVDKLHYSFMNSEKLKKHMRCLFTYGGMYLVCNSNLLYHASVPLNEDGSFKRVNIRGKEYWGKKLMDKIDQLIRTAYFDEDGDEEKLFAMDYIWYMWCGPDAPSFDKDKMATFERYFIADKALHKEKKGYYYTLRDNEKICDRILEEFGVTGVHTHIINGHVPVKTIKGEQPMKAGGKLLVIDGGFSKAYQPETGIAGYTLVYHSHGLQLVQHEPFQSTQKAIEEGQDIKSTTFVIEFNSQRMMVKDMDKGKELVTQIQDLKKLLVAYRTGLIKEKQ